MRYLLKVAFFLKLLLVVSSPAIAASGGGGSSSWVSQAITEGGFCVDCARRALEPIDLRFAGGYGGGGWQAAYKAFQGAASHYSKDCLAKPYVVITDLSRGTANNMTYIMQKQPGGGFTIVDQFQTGEGSQGVGNESGSNRSPVGLFRLTNFNYYSGKNLVRTVNGKKVSQRYTWPIFNFGSGNVNFIGTSGLEPRNQNLASRSAVLHPITYSTGDTTNGCKGFPVDKFKQWAPKLTNSCAYNYSGVPSPGSRRSSSSDLISFLFEN